MAAENHTGDECGGEESLDGTPFHSVGDAGAEQETDDGADPVDLVHMNGRVYDPEFGRFMSPDVAIQDISNQQSLNAKSPRFTFSMRNIFDDFT